MGMACPPSDETSGETSGEQATLASAFSKLVSR